MLNPCDIRRWVRFLVREFAPPYKASDTEAAGQCFAPMRRSIFAKKQSSIPVAVPLAAQVSKKR